MPRFLAMMDAQWGVCVLSASTGSGRHRGGSLARLVERNAMAGFGFFAGIDWGSETHYVCVVDSDGKTVGQRSFQHSGTGLAEMTDWLLAAINAQPHDVGVAIEVPHGPVVEALMERGFTIHAINPKQLDRFRDRWSPAGAKDDRRDAWTLADALRTDNKAFRRLDPAAPEIVELREWSRIASDLTRDQTRLVNRARQQLWRYYPQFLKVESNLARPWVRELWNLVPTPEKAGRIRARTVASLLKRHRVRSDQPRACSRGCVSRRSPLPLAPPKLRWPTCRWSGRNWPSPASNWPGHTARWTD